MPVLRIRDKNGNFVPLNAIRGARGKSAYEQAIEGGYKGSEKEFIALLNGMDGHYSDFDNPHKVTAEQAGAASQEQFDLLESNFLSHVNEEAVALDEEIGNLKLGVQRLDGEVTSQAGSLMACEAAISQLETSMSENKPVLLWENASPTSAFAGQTITLDLSPYSRILVDLNTSQKLDEGNGRTVWLSAIGTDTVYVKNYMFQEWCRMGFYRSMLVYSDRIQFSSGLYYESNNSYSAEGDYAVIPLKIWGIK